MVFTITRFSWWIFPLFLASWGFAQPCDLVLTGRILDEHDESPLPFTSVYLVESGQGTLADEYGLYRLERVCPGEYTLMASHVGCEPERIRVRLDRDTVIHIHLEHHIEVLDVVTASAYRLAPSASQTRSELSGMELQRLQGRSLAQMLSGISGVNMVQTGPGIQKPVIHGLYGSRILLVQNEVRQEGQQWGIDHAPEIDPTVAGKITVIKGAEGVRYGPDALGGVILVTPDPLPRTTGVGGTLMNELQSNGRGGKLAGTVQGGFRKEGWGWRSTGSLKILGDMAAPRYMLSNTGVQEIGWSAQLGYTGNRHTLDLYYSLYKARFGILRAAHIGSLSNLEEAISAPEPWYQRPFRYGQINPRQAVTHHLIKAEASRQIDHIWTMKGRYSFQWDDRQEFDVRRGDRNDRPALDLRILSGLGEVQAEHRTWRRWKGLFGAAFQHQSNFNIPGTGTRPLIPNYLALTSSLFAMERYIRERYEFEAGVRYDHRFLSVSRYDRDGALQEPTYHFRNLNVSGGGLYRFGRHWTALFNLGTAFRAPGVNELFSEGLHHASAAIEEGDDRLGVEKGIKAVATLRRSSNYLEAEWSGYLHHIRGFIYLQPSGETALTIRGAFPVFRYAQTDARLLGSDLSLRFQPWSWVYWLGQASLLWAEDLRHDEFLFGMPPIQARQELGFRIGTPAGTLDLSLNARHMARQRRNPNTDFMPAPDAYSLLGVNISLERPRQRLTAGVDNLLNSSYRDYLDRLRYFADGPGRNLYVKYLWQF